MKFLTELTEDIEYLVEDEIVAEGVAPKKSRFINGVFLQKDTKNKNGRIYPGEMLGKEVNRYNEQYVAKNRAYGELNHPTEPSINLDKVSHLITSLKEDGNNIIGKAKILENTPNGKIVSALMDENCRLGVSSRGLGSLKEKNGSKIVESLLLTTAADIVADPSVSDAFVDNLMENTEWFLTDIGWQKKEAAMDIINEHKEFSKEAREARFLEMFNTFMKKVNG